MITMENLKGFLWPKFMQYLMHDAFPSLLKLMMALTILIIGLIIGRYIKRACLRGFSHLPGMDQTVKPFLASMVRYLVLTITFVIVLSEFGIQTTSIIALLGAIGVAIGLALQGALSNVAAGIMLLFLRPIRVGDMIESGTFLGKTLEVGLFNTTIRTANGVTIVIPNALLFSQPIQNYHHHPVFRLELPISVAYSSDLSRVEQVLLSVAEEDKRIKLKPEKPYVLFQDFEDSGIKLQLRCWTHVEDRWDLKSDLIIRTQQALKDAGIEMPFPHRVIEVRNGSMLKNLE